MDSRNGKRQRLSTTNADTTITAGRSRQAALSRSHGQNNYGNIALPETNSPAQTINQLLSSRLNQISAGFQAESSSRFLADDSSDLSSTHTSALNLDLKEIEALEKMSEDNSNKGAQAPRVKKRQRLQDKAPAGAGPVNGKAAAIPIWTLPPGVKLNPNSLSARQPINPITEPLRAAALWEEEAGRVAMKNLEAAESWRDEVAQKRVKWLQNHGHEIHSSKLRHQFAGWVELEADPDYFTIMLKRLDIERAKVVEVHSLDEMLSNHHCLKYGILFLSKYHDEHLDAPDEEIPKDLWFANQIVDNACATVALLNIVNNVKTLKFGQRLKHFKGFTKPLDSVTRGQALSNFHWCRNIHNAFAKKTEILAANLALQQEAKANSSGTTKGKGKRKRKADDKETANHYIAYVPFAGAIWKLDGMDKHPRKLGPLVNGEAWINAVRDDIRKRMALFADDSSAGYTILGLVEDKLPSLIEMLGRSVNYLNCIESCIARKRRYFRRSLATEADENKWAVGREPIRGPDFRFDLTQEILDSDGVCFTEEQKSDLATCSEEHLKWIRPGIVDGQMYLREQISTLIEERAGQWAKYRDRMFDYGPVIHQWLKFLEANGNLEDLIEWHLEHGFKE